MFQILMINSTKLLFRPKRFERLRYNVFIAKVWRLIVTPGNCTLTCLFTLFRITRVTFLSRSRRIWFHWQRNNLSRCSTGGLRLKSVNFFTIIIIWQTESKNTTKKRKAGMVNIEKWQKFKLFTKFVRVTKIFSQADAETEFRGRAIKRSLSNQPPDLTSTTDES